MWYNEEQQTRGYVITFPDGTSISAVDAGQSPINGWEFNTDPPAWWDILYPPIPPQQP
jgi:hypothetical protein